MCNIPLRFLDCTSFAMVVTIAGVVLLIVRGWEVLGKEYFLQAGKELPTLTVSAASTFGRVDLHNELEGRLFLITRKKAWVLHISNGTPPVLEF